MHGRHQHELPRFQDRLDRQAANTRSLRHPLYDRAGLDNASRILDVGCGSGGVTLDLAAFGSGQVVALDLDNAMARRSSQVLGGRVTVLQADGAALPFADDQFDVAVCNLLLLWAPDPEAVVREMARVVRPGGTVLASMEPDYGGKVHWPENPLIDLVFQGKGIQNRGGDPHAGRKLRSHFVRAGLRPDIGLSTVEVLSSEQDLDLFNRNRGYYRRLLSDAGCPLAAIAGWEEEYLEALSAGIQMSFLPLFYAMARKPVPGDIDQA